MAKKPPHSALLDASPEHLKYIGLVAANWALLEGGLCRLLAFMADMDYPGARAIIYTITSNKVRRDIIANFAASQGFSKESLKELDKVLGKIKRLATKRNDYQHYAFSIAAKGEVLLKKPSARDNTDFKSSVTVDDLKNHAEQIALTSTRLTELCAVFHGQVQARKKKTA